MTTTCTGRHTGSNTLLFALVALLFGCLYQVSTPMIDDYWFSEGSRGLHGLAEKLAWLGDIWQSRRLTDTWRLANVIGPVFLVILPRLVFSVCTALMIFAALRCGGLIIVPRRGSMRPWLWATAFVFYLPWYDGMMCVMFAVNYVWTTALVLAVVWWLLCPGNAAGSRLSLPAVAVAFMAGWFHEGLSFPVLCGGFAMLSWEWLQTRRASRSRIVLLLAVLAGFSMVLTAASFWSREGGTESLLHVMPLREAILQTGPSLAAACVYLATLSAAVARRRRAGARRLFALLTEADVFFVGAVSSALFLELRYFGGARLGWAPELFAILGSLRLWGEWSFRLRMVWRAVWKLLLALLIAVHFGCAMRLQMRLRAEARDIAALYQASPTGTIYYDTIKPRADVTLLKSSVTQFHQRVPTAMFAHYYDPDKTLVILPSEMAGFKVEDARESSRTPGIYIYNSCIVANPSAIPADARTIELETTDRTVLSSRYRGDTFTADDGCEYVLITPHFKVISLLSSFTVSDAWF